MKIYFIRHGMTKGNKERRYVGRTDEGLLQEGNGLPDKEKMPEITKLYVSPLRRCRETAELLYPGREQRIAEGLRECDFGAFEYRSYEELNQNPDYQRFIDTMGESGFPGGESLKEFQARCVKAFEQAVKESREQDILSFVVHGGTIMAVLDCFSLPHKDYYEWQCKNGAGYEAQLRKDKETGRYYLTDIARL